MGKLLSRRLVQTPCLEFVHSWLCYKLKDSPNKKHTHKEENNKNNNGKVLGGPSPPQKHTHTKRQQKQARKEFRRRAGYFPLAGPPLVTRGRAAFFRAADVIVAASAHKSLRKVFRVCFAFRGWFSIFFCFVRGLRSKGHFQWM